MDIGKIQSNKINIFVGINKEYIDSIEGTKIIFGNILKDNIETIKLLKDCYYLVGAKDFKYIENIKCYNFIQVETTKGIIGFLCGGIKDTILKLNEIQNSVDVCIGKGKEDWHDKYKGKLGYLISNNLIEQDGLIKYYNYSANIYKRGFCHIEYTDRLRKIYES